MSSKPTLTYFGIRGRAEPIRWALECAGVKYEDKRLQQADWPSYKPKTPLGSLPVLTVDGKDLAQSGAVAHYVAAKYGLNGSDAFQAAMIHSIWDTTQEVLDARFKPMFCENAEEKAKLQAKYLEENLPSLLSYIKPMLAGGKKWLVGDKMSLADIAVTTVLELPDEACTAVVAKVPEVQALVKRVCDVPAISKWRKTRPETPM